MISIIEKKLYKYCNELNIQIQELSIILSFSGGIDSTVLASLLIELRYKYKFELILIHFNHNAHKKAQKMDRFCQSFAQKNNVDYYSKMFYFIKKANFEAYAREKRYFELINFSNKLDIPIVFTAHHLDDQIETLYMKILDKSDWISQIGIRDNIGKLKRPILNVQKEVIRKTAKVRKLKWIEDPSNEDISIRRNNVRKFLLPNILEESPGIKKKLLDNAKAYKLRMEIILSNLDNNKNEFIKYESYEYLSIVTNKIKNFKIEHLKIFMYWCTSKHFKINILQQSRQFWIEFSNYLKQSRTGSKFNFGSIRTIKNRGELLLIPANSDLLAEPEKIKLTQNKKWYSSYFHILENQNTIYSINKNQFSIPLSLFKRGLYMRRWKKGDRILSFSLKKYILISNLFINNKLSMIGKLIHPIIVDKTDQIVWVPGIMHAELQIKPIKQKIKVIEWVQE